MKNTKRLVSLLLLLCIAVSLFAGCNNSNQGGTDTTTSTDQVEVVDYAAAVKLDVTSGRAQQEVTVKQFIDGDTTHFYVPASMMPGGVLKARYRGIRQEGLCFYQGEAVFRHIHHR